MQTTRRTKRALIGASLTILASVGIATAAAPGEQPLAPAYKALDALVGDWTGSSVVYVSPGVPPTNAKATESGQKVGQFWAQLRLETKYMGQPYSEVLMLGWDGKAGKATGSIFSSADPTPRTLTGNYDVRTGVWTLFHDTLNSAGQVVSAKSTLDVDARSGKYTFQRYQVLGDNFESLALEVHGTRRGR